MQIDVSPEMAEKFREERLARMANAAKQFDSLIDHAKYSGFQGALIDVLDTFEFVCLKLVAIEGHVDMPVALRLLEMVFLRKREKQEEEEREMKHLEELGCVDG